MQAVEECKPSRANVVNCVDEQITSEIVPVKQFSTAANDNRLFLDPLNNNAGNLPEI